MATETNIPAIIDIEKVIGAKNPRLLKRLPRFVINYIKRTIHQDEVNYIVHTYGNRSGLEFNDAVIKEHLHSWYEAHGLDDIPLDNRYIFASNHPLGAFDGLILMSAIGKRFPNLRFMVNDLLLHLKPFDPLFVPINKYGKQSATNATLIDETYASDNQVLYFPAGLCSRRIHGKITDLPWKPSFVQKAIQYKRDIVPVYFDGRNSNFFYNLSSIRKFFGIKANIELFYLPDELFKQKNKNFNLYFGKPIPYEMFDKSRTIMQWTNFVREKVYEMQPDKQNK